MISPGKGELAFTLPGKKKEQETMRCFFLSSNPQDLLLFFLDLHYTRNPPHKTLGISWDQSFPGWKRWDILLGNEYITMRCHLGA